MINLLVDLFVLRIDPQGLVLVHVHLTQKAFFQIEFVPCPQDNRVVDLPQIGKILSFIDLFADLGDQDSRTTSEETALRAWPSLCSRLSSPYFSLPKFFCKAT